MSQAGAQATRATRARTRRARRAPIGRVDAGEAT